MGFCKKLVGHSTFRVFQENRVSTFEHVRRIGRNEMDTVTVVIY